MPPLRRFMPVRLPADTPPSPMRLLSLLAILLLIPTATGQTRDTPLEPGARALVFGVGSDISLTVFDQSDRVRRWDGGHEMAHERGPRPPPWPLRRR